MRIIVASLLVVTAAACEQPARKPPAPTVTDDLISIPGGTFIGRALHCRDGVIDSPPDDDLVKLYKVTQTIDAFSIDRTETSCDDYKRCVDAGSCRPRPGSRGQLLLSSARGGLCSAGKALAYLPEATAYCEWRGMRLPKLAELQRAVRSTDGRPFPTGETWDPSICDTTVEKCRLTSPDGLSYAVNTGDGGEWTSDTECLALEAEGLVRGQVRLDFSELLPYISVAAPGPARFRCSK